MNKELILEPLLFVIYIVYGHVHLSLRILVNISDPTKWHDEAKFITV